MSILPIGEHHPRSPYKPPISLTVIVNPQLEAVGEDTIAINRTGTPHERIYAGLSATAQHKIDHLDGILLLDRVTDTRTLSTWRQFDAHHREAFERRAADIVERHGS